MPDEDKTEKTSIRFTPTQRERWDALATADERSLADWMRVTIDRATGENAVLINATPEQITAWTAEAESDRRSLEDWIRLQLDDAAKQKPKRK